MDINTIITTATKSIYQEKDYPGVREYLVQLSHQNPDPVEGNILKLLKAITSCYMGRFEESYLIFGDIFDFILANIKELSLWWKEFEIIEIMQWGKAYDKKLRFIDAYLQYFPNNADMLNKKAVTYFHMHDFDKAVVNFLAALKLDPGNSRIQYSVANSYINMDNYNEAFTYFEQALDSGSEQDDYYRLATAQLYKILIERTGDCNSCNGLDTCCKNIRLNLHEKVVTEQAHFDKIREVDPRNENWVHMSENEKGEWLFDCKYILQDGKCSNHPNRPNVCRRFPSYFWDITNKPHCSYKFVLREGLPPFASPKVFGMVIDFLKAKEKLDFVEQLITRNKHLAQ